MKKIIYVLLVCLLACKTEAKKPIVKEVIKKENNSLKATVIIKKPTVKKIVVEDDLQIPLDYSLKANDVKILQDSAKYLAHYFNQFEETNDSLSEVLFFKMFPNNFKDFKKLYGYQDLENNNFIKSPLYSSYKHIHNYEPLNVSIKDYLKKIISIAINADWQFENVNIIQKKLSNFYKSDTELFFNLLIKKSQLQSELSSFWVFFFDGPHPEKASKVKVYEDILEQLESIDTSMIPIVKEAYAKVKEDWAEH